MIKAIVVDDEKLVRKGFISMIDWPAYGIAIVGEAGDGHAALELLKSTPVDLMFTDLTMPGLSGLELIRYVRQQYPHTRTVVLTCHHEFEYIQEALRLGVMDYIVKTLLEMDNVEETLTRIVDRYRWELALRGVSSQDGTTKLIPASSALLLRPHLQDAEQSELFVLSAIRSNPYFQLDQWTMVPLVHTASLGELNRELTRSLRKRWGVAILTGLRDLPMKEVQDTVIHRLEEELFYCSIPDQLTFLSYGELLRKPSTPVLPRVTEGSWLVLYTDMKWAFAAAEWDSFVRIIEERRPNPIELRSFGETLCRDWEGYLLSESEAEELMCSAGSNHSWADWKLWLRRVADCAQRRMAEMAFSKEVMGCLTRALIYMRSHACDKINQSEVAEHVKMSRSYFSQCFTRFAHEPFNVVLRNLRMERAKTYLLESDTPVYEIALSVGFEDDKYFSKLFRDLVGKYPTEFRMMGGKPF